MTAFVDKVTVEGLSNRMKLFLTKEDSAGIEKRLGPIIDECENTLTLYSKEHKQMKEIIARFDEVISEKVNKKDWTMQIEKIQKSYASKEEGIKLNKYVTEQLSQVKTLSE